MSEAKKWLLPLLQTILSDLGSNQLFQLQMANRIIRDLILYVDQQANHLFIVGRKNSQTAKMFFISVALIPVEPITLDVVYGGDGSKEALANLNTKGKAVLFSRDANSSSRRELSKTAYSQGAELVLLEGAETDEEWKSWVPRYSRLCDARRAGFTKPSTDNGVFYIGPSTAASILNLPLEKYEAQCTEVLEGNYSNLTKLKSGKLTYATETIIDKVGTENIMGYLEGTDKKDELIVLTAHYDHIGTSGESINNGADDDGSGTSAILELAEAYVYAKKAGNGPRRSILFMTVTGEEKGLT